MRRRHGRKYYPPPQYIPVEVQIDGEPLEHTGGGEGIADHLRPQDNISVRFEETEEQRRQREEEEEREDRERRVSSSCLHMRFLGGLGERAD